MVASQELVNYVDLRYYQGGHSKLIINHYTSLDALESILTHKLLFATDISYLNDQTELRGALTYIADVALGRKAESKIFLLFSEWMRNRAFEHSFYITCFSTERSLLSQWRSYCQPGRGVSLNIPFVYLLDLCKKNGFRIGKCRYGTEEHYEMASAIMTVLLAQEALDPNTNWEHYFESLEDQILQLAMLMKNPSFKEESEWRAIARAAPLGHIEKVRLRLGRTTLIPYIPFSLAPPFGHWKVMQLGVTLGPTPNEALSKRAAQLLMTQHALTTDVGVCGIPYRDAL